MSIGQHGVGSDLVAGLIDARDTPASDRFDAELEAAVEAGQLTLDAARRLRMWQRASVSELADHIRAVLPTALAALADAREAANRRVQERQSSAEQATPHVAANGSGSAVADDTPEPASVAEPAAPSSLGATPARLMLADLVVSTPPVRHDHS
jgi:hypothetical protein